MDARVKPEQDDWRRVDGPASPAAAFDLTPEMLPRDASMDTVAQWDSLGHLTLIGALEKRFGVAFAHQQMVELLDEQALLDALAARLR